MHASMTRDSAVAAPPLAVAATPIQAQPKSRDLADSATAPRFDVHIMVCGGLTNGKATKRMSLLPTDQQRNARIN